jgi:NAD(P)H-dependent FMN reductase
MTMANGKTKTGEHVHEHSKRWSAKMSSYGGYVFVTPEYNYGMAGSTKNAIDFLYNEIINKPALIITYGIHGGKHSSEALKTTLEGMKLRVAKTRPALPFHGGRGPDMFAAAKGELGGDTKNDWEKEKKGEVEQGLKELEQLLREEVTPRKEGES